MHCSFIGLMASVYHTPLLQITNRTLRFYVIPQP